MRLHPPAILFRLIECRGLRCSWSQAVANSWQLASSSAQAPGQWLGLASGLHCPGISWWCRFPRSMRDSCGGSRWLHAKPCSLAPIGLNHPAEVGCEPPLPNFWGSLTLLGRASCLCLCWGSGGLNGDFRAGICTAVFLAAWLVHG